MARPFFSSSFCALITGGRNAPSDGGPNTTIESGSGACANDAPDDSNAATQARPAKYLFIKLLRNPCPQRSEIFSQAEQAAGQAAIDRRALAIREFGFRDDLGGREIADWKRHVGTHHDPLGADDIGQIA